MLAVVSVGGGPGVGGTAVAIPYGRLKSDGGKTLPPGASKGARKAMPNFTYNG